MIKHWLNLLIILKKNEENKIDNNLINKKLNQIGNALNMVTSGTNKNEIANLDRQYTNCYTSILSDIQYC